jgi:hypothetical protein
MMRTLIAIAALVACSGAWAEVTLIDINNNEIADAEVVMANFNALKDGVEANAAAIDVLPTPPTDCTINQIIRWDGSLWICSDETAADNTTVRGWYYTASFNNSTSPHAIFESRSLNARNYNNIGGQLGYSIPNPENGSEAYMTFNIAGVGSFENCVAIMEHVGVTVTNAIGNDSYYLLRFRNYSFGIPMKVVIECADSAIEPEMP